MQREVWLGGLEFEMREHVRDNHGFWICKDMLVLENTEFNLRRMGYVADVLIDENKIEKIKVKVVHENGKDLQNNDFYVTNFDLSANWIKAIAEG